MLADEDGVFGAADGAAVGEALAVGEVVGFAEVGATVGDKLGNKVGEVVGFAEVGATVGAHTFPSQPQTSTLHCGWHCDGACRVRGGGK